MATPHPGAPGSPAGIAAPEPSPRPGQNAAGPPLLLVCADSRVVAPGWQALQEAGFRLHRAAAWSEALGSLDALRPAAVLIDGGFLEGQGPELCAALRRHSGRVEVPVLALVGSRRDQERAFRAGASDVVRAPLDWGLVGRRLTCLHRAFRASEEVERSRRLLDEARRLVAEAWDRIERQTATDALTGLPSRLRLDEVVERALARGRRGERGVALLLVDLDRFSEINETLGRRSGDEVLKAVAQRLLRCLRESSPRGTRQPGLALAARLAGDEFALMLASGVETQALSRFAGEVLEALQAPLTVGGTEVHLSASTGIAVAAAHEMDAEALLQHAETAMYDAKRGGGGQIRFYSEALAGIAESRLGLDRRLRAAFERRELALHYQPVLEAGSRRLVAVEALLRWADPEQGWIPPGEFVPVAEDTGLMNRIGSWVLETACHQLKSWIDEGLPPVRVAVNVSRCQLERGDLAAEVERVLAETGLDSTLLELELSERGALRSDPAILSQLRRIKRLGVRLVVDDFGTGQAGVSYLRQFDLDGLKIDRSFVAGMLDSEDDDALTAAMVAMAQRLHMDVTAEGVETEAQRVRICEYGCQAVQGFLFARALPPQELRGRLTLRGGQAELGLPPEGGTA